jgi:hypothetical protein
MKKGCKVIMDDEHGTEIGTLTFFKKIRSVRQRGGNWKRFFSVKIQIPEGIINMTVFKTKGQTFYQEYT